MDGNSGYCSNVAGTIHHTEAVAAYLNILSESNCHTSD